MTLFSYQQKVQYYETDQMGIVHHSNYIRWFEEARTAWMDAIGFSYARMEEEGIVVPVLAVDCIYKTMTKYGESVDIELSISAFTGVRLSFAYHIYDSETKELRATGESKHAFLNKEYRPVSIKRNAPKIYQLIENTMSDKENK